MRCARNSDQFKESSSDTWQARICKAGRDNYPASGAEALELTRSDGPGASFDAMEDILRSLLDLQGTVSE